MSHSETILSILNTYGKHPVHRYGALRELVYDGYIGEAFKDAMQADISGKPSNNTSAHNVMRKVSVQISELDKTQRIEFNSRLLRACLHANDRCIRSAKLMEQYPPKEQWHKTDEGRWTTIGTHIIPGGQFYFITPGQENPTVIRYPFVERGERFAERYTQVVSGRIRRDILEEKDINMRFELAQKSYALLGSAFVENVLKSPDEIRNLIIATPDRGSIAFGYILPKESAAYRFK
jgi:hypothetical protein